jgi:hypothetical protein
MLKLRHESALLSFLLDFWIEAFLFHHHIGEHSAVFREGSHGLAALLDDGVAFFFFRLTILIDFISNVVKAAALTLLLKADDDVALLVDLVKQGKRWRDVHVGATFRRNDVLDDLNDVLRVTREHGRVDDVCCRKLKADAERLEVHHLVEVSSALLIAVRLDCYILEVLCILCVGVIARLAAKVIRDMAVMVRDVFMLVFKAIGIGIDVTLRVVLGANHT